MHQLIRMLVPGTTQDDTLARAHSALDELVGVYDYYNTFYQADSLSNRTSRTSSATTTRRTSTTKATYAQ